MARGWWLPWCVVLGAPVVAVAQPGGDARSVHEWVAFATVEIPSANGSGTGWLLEQSGRPVVITSRAVAEGIGDGAPVRLYGGPERAPVEVRATKMFASPRIDLAVLRLEGQVPASARPLRLRTAGAIGRGQRVILGGHPAGMSFQTTEAIVTGHAAGPGFEPCSAGRGCLLADAPAFTGTSGGPAVDLQGGVVGMTWAGPTPGPRFVHLIHVRAIAEELRALEAAVAAAAPPRPPALPQSPPRDAVAAAMSAARTRVAACGGSGRVSVTVVVAGSGRVQRVEMTGTGLPPTVSQCIRTAMLQVQFPPFARDNFTFTFPYQLGRPPR